MKRRFSRAVLSLNAVATLIATAFAYPISSQAAESPPLQSRPGSETIAPKEVGSSAMSQNSIMKNTSTPPKLKKMGVELVKADEKSGIHEFKLTANGLRILLVEQHATPVVSTTMVYHVGSRNEAVGYTGATHFLEHMMFKGTTRHDPLKKNGFDDLLKAVGGINNATTWYDRTNYFEVVPSNNLELCIELEADRMRNLLLRESDREAEMTVVRNELERGEDDPDELLDTSLFATAFREHPYHHPVIGWRSDVEGVPTARLKKFYDDFYWPNNATIIVIGDLEIESALEVISRHFSDIARSSEDFPPVYTVEPPQEGERRFVVRRGRDLPRAIIGFHVPECLSEDTYALDVAETILGDGSKTSSRLYKALMDTGLASNVNAMNYSLKNPGLFVLTAQAAMKSSPEKLEKAILLELERMKTEPVSDDELKRAQQSLYKSQMLATSDPLRFSSHLTEALAVADWPWWLEYPAKIKKVTKEDVLRVCKKYLQEDNRTVGYYFPKPGKSSEEEDGDDDEQEEGGVSEVRKYSELENSSSTEKGAAPDAESGTTATPQDSGDQKQVLKIKERVLKVTEKTASKRGESASKAGRAASINIAKRVERVVLDNGLTLMLLPLPGSGTVAISGKILAGDCFASQDKSQIPYLVSETLTRGSSKFTKEALSKELENMGASLELYTSNFWSEFDTEVVKEDLPRLMEIIEDVLIRPTFPAKEIDLEKKLRESDLQEDMSDTGEVSWNKLVRALYRPESAFYEKDFKSQVDELKTIDRKDLEQFHKTNYKPVNMVLALVGDIDPESIEKTCKKLFGSTASSGAKKNSVKITASETNEIKTGEEIRTNLPDKANVDVSIGLPLPLSIKSDEYFAAVIANAALGYDSFATRLAPLRDEYGLTYGIYSSIDDPTQPYGPWTIRYTVNPKNLKKANEIVAKILKDYKEGGITEAELTREKAHLSGVYSVYLRSARHIASRLSFYEAAGVGPDYIDGYPQKLEAVTISEVNAVIKRYFDLSKAVTSISGTIERGR